MNKVVNAFMSLSHVNYVSFCISVPKRFLYQCKMTVGFLKILSLLESDDPNARIHAVKVVANLAAEG